MAKAMGTGSVMGTVMGSMQDPHEKSSDKRIADAIRQSGEFHRKVTGRASFLDSMEKNAANLRKSHDSKKSMDLGSKGTSKAGEEPVQRGPMDIGVISDEAISYDPESDAPPNKKKKDDDAEGEGDEGEVKFHEDKAD